MPSVWRLDKGDSKPVRLTTNLMSFLTARAVFKGIVKAWVAEGNHIEMYGEDEALLIPGRPQFRAGLLYVEPCDQPVKPGPGETRVKVRV